MRKIARALAWMMDFGVLAVAFTVLYVSYDASVVKPEPQSPTVDWSESYEAWRGTTGDIDHQSIQLEQPPNVTQPQPEKRPLPMRIYEFFKKPEDKKPERTAYHGPVMYAFGGLPCNTWT